MLPGLDGPELHAQLLMARERMQLVEDLGGPHDLGDLCAGGLRRGILTSGPWFALPRRARHAGSFLAAHAGWRRRFRLRL